ncbi:MAG: hypothetical protein AAF939_04915 [Planctomycetota bacterium]
MAATLSANYTIPGLTRFPDDNKVLVGLFDADQADRKAGSMNSEIINRDKERRSKALEELRGGRLKTASDFYHAAMVFQHGHSADDLRLAFSLAWTSAQIEESERALWLSAAAWDRLMMRLEKPQWYGTQYVSDKTDSQFRLYEIDEKAVTDEERTRFHVPVLSEAKKKVEVLNRRFPGKPKKKD